MIRAFCVILVAAFAVPAAYGGNLRFGAPAVENGRYVFSVFLNGQDNVAALDFRVQYDPGVFRPLSAETGSAALHADKTVAANVPVPGEYVVVMMGFNQNTVAGGEVARIALERLGGEDIEASRLYIRDTTFSTWDGVELPSEGSDRVVRFTDSGVPREEEPAPDDAPPATDGGGDGAPAEGGVGGGGTPWQVSRAAPAAAESAPGVMETASAAADAGEADEALGPADVARARAEAEAARALLDDTDRAAGVPPGGEDSRQRIGMAGQAEAMAEQETLRGRPAQAGGGEVTVEIEAPDGASARDSRGSEGPLRGFALPFALAAAFASAGGALWILRKRLFS